MIRIAAATVVLWLLDTYIVATRLGQGASDLMMRMSDAQALSRIRNKTRKNDCRLIDAQMLKS